ncbi:hypothetical protein ACVWY2_006565 [Bradyrhizobium sp. JR6.1]
MTDRRQSVGENARLLKEVRQRCLDSSNLHCQPISRYRALDAIVFGSEMAFRLDLFLGQDGERVVQRRNGGRCHVHGAVQVIERALIVEIARQQRCLAGLGSFVQSLLGCRAHGDELFAALRQRGDGGFELLHLCFSEWISHSGSLGRRTLLV